MDIELILIILVIVIIIGYVLSRPFMKAEKALKDTTAVRGDAGFPQQSDLSPEEEGAIIQNNTHAESHGAGDVSSRCPFCGKRVMSNDKFCPHCGRRIKS